MEDITFKSKSKNENVSSNISEPLQYRREQEARERNFYFGSTKKELEEIFEVAPLKAKNIVNRIQNPYMFKRGTIRAAFLVGESGVGKTTLSIAMAYQAGPEWLCEFLTPASIKGEEKNSRGQTAINLFKKLNMISRLKVKVIVIIDELNRILENYHSKDHDTDEIADALWTFLDKQRHNYNFFLIGTMNRADKLPEQIKSRIKGLTIEIPKLDFNKLVQTFLTKIIDETTQLHSDCTNEYLSTLFQNTQFAGRDLDVLVDAVVEIFRRTDMQSEIAIITKEHLEQAFAELEDIGNRILVCGKKEETNEERSERHHQEVINNQNNNHRDNINNQNNNHREVIDKQNEHFVQQLIMQIASQGDFKNNSPHEISKDVYLKIAAKYGGHFNEKDLSTCWIERMLNFISDEQIIQFNNTTMHNTYQRRLNEKRIKETEEQRKEEERKQNTWW